MIRNRLIFFIVFGIFHLGALIFTVMLDNDTGLLFKMVSYVPSFKWITLFGFFMVVGDFLWFLKDYLVTKKEKAALTQELDTLKARLFDLQEAAKKQNATTNTQK
jgi:hypothetical protein